MCIRDGVLGYTKAQTFLRIILPKVVKRVMPSVTNEVVTLVKDTSMAFTVSYQEMFLSLIHIFCIPLDRRRICRFGSS